MLHGIISHSFVPITLRVKTRVAGVKRALNMSPGEALVDLSYAALEVDVLTLSSPQCFHTALLAC